MSDETYRVGDVFEKDGELHVVTDTQNGQVIESVLLEFAMMQMLCG